MAHVLSKRYDFAFIHIPKNGGTNFRETLNRYDDSGYHFGAREICHAELGRIWIGHLPLWAMQAYYPNHFSTLKNTWSFAITRDPHSRFASSLAQRCRQFLKVDPSRISVGRLRREAMIVADYMTGLSGVPQTEFCHFIPQIDFVQISGDFVVKSVYPLEELDRLRIDFCRRTGIVVPEGKKNSTSVVRFGRMGRTLASSWSAARPFVSTRISNALRANLSPLLLRQASSQDFSFIHEEPILSFINEYYRDDFELHRGAHNASGTG